MKKEKAKILKEKYAGSFGGKDPKKEDRLTDLEERKRKLERAAKTAAKMRDEELKKKKEK